MKNKTIIPERVFFRIGDVAEILGVKPYVIRFWETEFPFITPDKSATGQRVYRRTQIESLVLVKHLLHIERYSIEGAKKKLTELRRQSRMKETVNDLVQIAGAPEQDEKQTVKIGDRVSAAVLQATVLQKDQILEKINELQTLIRKPETMGLDVPKLGK